jgi:hypothetical protein
MAFPHRDNPIYCSTVQGVEVVTALASVTSIFADGTTPSYASVNEPGRDFSGYYLGLDTKQMQYSGELYLMLLVT